jgi:hypothetical protein
MAKQPADKSKAKAAAVPDEQQVLVRELARAIWFHEFKSTHPGADVETRKADWAENKVIYMKLGRSVTQILKRKNITLQHAT